ncbi:hypothetical protein F2P81_009561 [Scophthalmus maximus]|uniref:Uncharacterized protein n=1 Tax=Scophthalmus maximus TaxID=52904 RepID=A0A6A4SZE6_SCOMX|nr:hypothetical protein F2P81_009561 [Scophthalmus maximus]
MEIKRGCATLPNVNLALYPTIGTWDLYDGLQSSQREGQMSDTKREPNKLYELNRTYRWAPDSGVKFIIALNSPDLMNDISICDQNQYVPTRDGVDKVIDDINMIFHKEAIKADLIKPKRKDKTPNGLIKNARPSEKT